MKTNGFKFSVMDRDVDRMIREIVPNSSKSAVEDLRKKAKDRKSNTSCISLQFIAYDLHIRFLAPSSGRPAATVAVEYINGAFSNRRLEAEFNKLYKHDCRAQDFAILDPKKAAPKQI